MHKSRIGEFAGVVAAIAVAGLLMAKPWAGSPSSGKERPDLLLHLPLDGTVADASPNASATTPIGIVPAVDRHGKFDGACVFGRGSCVEVGDPKRFANLKELTVSAWVNPSALGEGVCLLANWPEGRDFAINITGHGQLAAFFAGGERMSAYTGNALLKPGVWTFVSASHRDKTWRFTVNGQELEGHPEQAFPSTGGDRPAARLTVGSFYPGAPGGFVGSMDDVRIHSRALELREIQDLMKS